MVNVAVSVKLDVSKKLKVAPTPLFVTARPVVAAILLNVVAAVLLLLSTRVTPAAPNKDRVAPVVSKNLMVSIPETLEVATVVPFAEPEMFRMSFPKPPTKVSGVLNVALAAVAVVLGALKISSPLPPVKLFESVVSGNTCGV